MTAILVNKVLSQLMEGMSEAEFAKLVNVPKATIHRLLSGKTPDPRVGTLAPIAQYFGISIEQLLGLSPLPDNLPLTIATENKLFVLPFIDFEQIYLYKKKSYLPDKYYEISSIKNNLIDNSSYLTNVNSTSMMPKFQENSYLLVNTTLEPRHDDYVIYYDEQEKVILFRKLIIEGSDKYLYAINPAFKTYKITKKFILLGIVIESRIFLK